MQAFLDFLWRGFSKIFKLSDWTICTYLFFKGRSANMKSWKMQTVCFLATSKFTVIKNQESCLEIQYWKQILLWYFRWLNRRMITDCCQLKRFLKNYIFSNRHSWIWTSRCIRLKPWKWFFKNESSILSAIQKCLDFC